jgi:hypothetical protein
LAQVTVAGAATTSVSWIGSRLNVTSPVLGLFPNSTGREVCITLGEGCMSLYDMCSGCKSVISLYGYWNDVTTVLSAGVLVNTSNQHYPYTKCGESSVPWVSVL